MNPKTMRALMIKRPRAASIEHVPQPQSEHGKILLRVLMVGLCGSDLNSFRGKNPMVQFPRILEAWRSNPLKFTKIMVQLD
jgi:threonine dehydrogenase-like Zn-dependent dehydrogenase